ncbi:MAG TPA: hypothetical protein VNU71_06465 [Burkholderiaceae bacterium]|nr:hypothetical protein [Burkholderiaceae bacterium]
MLPDTRTLREILAAGVFAPSAENRHYLQFALDADAVRLLTTDRTSWAALPHRRFLASLAYGAVLENLRLASSARGLALQVEPWPDRDGSDVVARLRWSPAAGAAIDPLADLIGARHTNRRFYRRQKVAPGALAQLQSAAAAHPGCALRWLDEPPLRAAALKAIRLAETERFRRRALHEELFGAVRFEIGWQASADEWLPPAALEVEPPARPAFALMRDWAWMQRANRIGAHLGFGLRAGWLPCKLAPHLGLVLGAPRDDAAALLDAGSAFQRVWLAATAEGLALQPFAAATVLTRQVPGGDWVAPATHAALVRLLGELRGPGEAQPMMLFRLGHAAAPSAVTGRLPLERYLA